MIGTLYNFEPCTRLNPVEEERMRMALERARLELFRLDLTDTSFPLILDAWIKATPPQGSSYLASGVFIPVRRTPARTRAKKRPVWWLPWRRKGGR